MLPPPDTDHPFSMLSTCVGEAGTPCKVFALVTGPKVALRPAETPAPTPPQKVRVVGFHAKLPSGPTPIAGGSPITGMIQLNIHGPCHRPCNQGGRLSLHCLGPAGYETPPMTTVTCVHVMRPPKAALPAAGPLPAVPPPPPPPPPGIGTVGNETFPGGQFQGPPPAAVTSPADRRHPDAFAFGVALEIPLVATVIVL